MPLNAKQTRFCEEYIKCLNATEAAKRAGYSKATAYSIGWENLRKPEIRAFIDTRLKECGFTPEETTKLIADTARGNLSDYFVKVKVEHTPRITKSLKQVIKEHEEEIAFEKEYAVLAIFNAKEKIAHNEWLQSMNRKLIRMQLELKRHPKATRIVNGETVFIEKVELDLMRLVADKEKGKIKSLKQDKNGIHIEILDPQSAQRDIAKMQGLFEKDNKQKAGVTQSLTDDQFNKLLTSAREAKTTSG